MECLAGSQFADLLGGVASPELARYIDAHVDACETCHQLMLDLVRAISYSATGGNRPRTAARDVQRLSSGGNPAAVSHRYRLLGLIGEGGMGRVYRALDRLNGTEVALKQVAIAPSLGRHTAAPRETLLPSAPRDLGTYDQLAGVPLPGDWRAGGQDDREVAASLGILAEEFRTLAGLRHPNVISVLDYGIDAAGQPFYTMELLAHAQPLLQFAQGLPATQQLELLIQILHALAYLHRRGIVHRDLTPGNVLVVPGPQGPVVKVVDFGLAIETEREQATSLAGTLLYMAPELFRGEAPSESSDLYAVGAMAYQILADRYPFDAQRGAAQLLQQVLGESPDLSPLMPALRPVIGRALSKDPANRQPDAVTLLRELAAAADISLKNEPVAARDSYLLAARFVGRKQELGQLRMALQAAQQDCGSAWLISGESGVGKSRLLEELRSSALISGVLSARHAACRISSPSIIPPRRACVTRCCASSRRWGWYKDASRATCRCSTSDTAKARSSGRTTARASRRIMSPATPSACAIGWTSATDPGPGSEHLMGRSSTKPARMRRGFSSSSADASTPCCYSAA